MCLVLTILIGGQSGGMGWSKISVWSIVTEQGPLLGILMWRHHPRLRIHHTFPFSVELYLHRALKCASYFLQTATLIAKILYVPKMPRNHKSIVVNVIIFALHVKRGKTFETLLSISSSCCYNRCKWLTISKLLWMQNSEVHCYASSCCYNPRVHLYPKWCGIT